MGRPKKTASAASTNKIHQRRGAAPKQVQDAIERHRADEAVAAKEEKIQQLKNSLHKTTASICTGLEKELGQQFSPAFVKAMAEASYHFAETVAKDVEAFRKHAKRATAMVDDVKLCTRRSRSLVRSPLCVCVCPMLCRCRGCGFQPQFSWPHTSFLFSFSL
eukprot:scpid99468/ scgid1025/ Centromere protein S